MPFQPGNTLAHRRKTKRGGQQTTTQKEIKKAAAEIAREYIEANVEPVLSNYLRMAKGYYETRLSDNGTEYELWVTDGPTTRHFVDKVLPNEQPETGTTINIAIGFRPAQGNQSQPELRPDSFQIRIGGNNGHNGNGSNGA
jgi:hypothetical protein